MNAYASTLLALALQLPVFGDATRVAQDVSDSTIEVAPADASPGTGELSNADAESTASVALSDTSVAAQEESTEYTGEQTPSVPESVQATDADTATPGADSSETVIGTMDDGPPAASNPSEEQTPRPPVPPRLTDTQMRQLEPTIIQKRKAIYAGSALLLSSALIDYALVLPQSRQLDPTSMDDMEDYFALISPQLLAFGLRLAGPPMACMRTSEVADSYERITGFEAPKNRSWTFYFCGWGLYAASSFITYLNYIPDTEVAWENVALGVGIGADLMWAFTCAYSYAYLQKLKNYRADTAEQPRAFIVPSSTRSGTPGAALVLTF